MFNRLLEELLTGKISIFHLSRELFLFMIFCLLLFIFSSLLLVKMTIEMVWTYKRYEFENDVDVDGSAIEDRVK